MTQTCLGFVSSKKEEEEGQEESASQAPGLDPSVTNVTALHIHHLYPVTMIQTLILVQIQPYPLEQSPIRS